MALPTYDKSKRKSTNFQQLPKGAYIIKILGAREDKWGSGDRCVRLAFDIAEGEYAGFYQNQFDNNTREDKQWPYDAVFTLNIPEDGCEQYIWDYWNSFFADLEDSNNGFIFSGDLKPLKGKIIGAKFYNKQSQKNGTVYDHIIPKAGWTCVAEDVRKGRVGKLPNDRLIGSGHNTSSAASAEDTGGFAPATEDDDIPPF